MKQIAFVVGGASVVGLILGLLSSSVLSQQTQPPLDISGIAEIRSIPVGTSRLYVKGDNRDGKFSMEKILESIANLAVMQFDVEKYTITITNSNGEKETVIGGEFGRILRKELLNIEITDITMAVKHIEFVQTPGLTPKFDEDKFKLDINGGEIELVLARDMGKPEKGFE